MSGCPRLVCPDRAKLVPGKSPSEAHCFVQNERKLLSTVPPSACWAKACQQTGGAGGRWLFTAISFFPCCSVGPAISLKPPFRTWRILKSNSPQVTTLVPDHYCPSSEGGESKCPGRARSTLVEPLLARLCLFGPWFPDVADLVPRIQTGRGPGSELPEFLKLHM